MLLILSKKGHDVNVFEKEAKILQGASKKNQFRFHLGYHYPRSQNTVNELKKQIMNLLNFILKMFLEILRIIMQFQNINQRFL